MSATAVSAPTEVGPGIYDLGSEVVNWYLVEADDALVAVDAGLPAYRDELEQSLERIGRYPDEVEAVVLTHSDADHTGVVPSLRAAGARVLIHAHDEPTLARPRGKGGDASTARRLPLLTRPSFWGFAAHMLRNGVKRPPRVAGAELFADDVPLDVPGSPRVVHTPGHTPGHSALWFEDRGVLFTGDALCTRNPVDGSEGPQLMPAAFNVSNQEALGSLGALGEVDAELVLPGHGEPWQDGAPDAARRARESAGATD